MKVLFKKLLGSFDTQSGGFSARKLSAFIAIVCVAAVVTHKFTNALNLVEVVAVWLCFAALCLGLVTLDQIIRLKNGSKGEEPKGEEATR